MTGSKSFRINNETAEKFKSIASQIGGNQQDTMAALIDAYETLSGRASMPNRKDAIDTYEAHILAIRRAYMSSLEEIETQEDKVKAKFEAQLIAKDNTINDLQGKVQSAEQARDEAERCMKESEDTARALEEKLEDAKQREEALKAQLADKTVLIESITKDRQDAEKEAESMREAAGQADVLRKEVAEAKTRIAALKKDMEQQKEKMTMDADRTLMENERRHQETIYEIKRQHQEEIDGYQIKYRELLEQMSLGMQEKEKNQPGRAE